MTARTVEREASVDSAAVETQTPAPVTNASEAPRAQIVAEPSEHGALPWTREVGIDARGAATPFTSVARR